MPGQTVEINSRISIPESELEFTASRSSGPGGQNVNKVSTRVTLWFDVVRSPSLSAEERTILLTRLRGRINKEGFLQVTSQESRSQGANREAAIRRFADILREALKIPTRRKKTSVTPGARARRLSEKKQKSLIKQQRSGKPSFDA